MAVAATRYWTAVGGVVVFFLLLYFVLDAMDIALLHAPETWVGRGGTVGAVTGVALLVADVVLPVPASIVMVANGTMFGFLVGAFLSIVGRSGAFLFGYWLGARALPLARRYIPESDMASARALLDRSSTFAILLTRPVPILSETMAIVAGVSSLPLLRSLLLAIVGSLPEALLFAAAGAYAARFDTTVLVFAALLLISAAFWVRSRRRAKIPVTTSESAAQRES